LNAETTAMVQEDSLLFEEKGQTIILSTIPSSAIIEVHLHISGFVIVEEAIHSTTPVFTLEVGQHTKTIQTVNEGGWYIASFFLAKSTEITLIFTNFATLEASSLSYKVIIDQIIVLKKGL
jgi:hypothetical protein